MRGEDSAERAKPMAQSETRREHVRADDQIPVYYEPYDASSAAAPEFDWEQMLDDTDPHPEENPKLYELLFDINQKLNILVRHLTDKGGLNVPEARDVNISGGGMKFTCKDSFKSGEVLLLKTFLPTYAHVIRLKCEVVRVMPSAKGGFDVAVKFLDMDEATRDKIIRYIFARQRKLLRTGKDEDKDA